MAFILLHASPAYLQNLGTTVHNNVHEHYIDTINNTNNNKTIKNIDNLTHNIINGEYVEGRNYQMIDHSNAGEETFGLQNLLGGMPMRYGGPAYSGLQNLASGMPARYGGPAYSSHLQNMVLTPEARMRGGPVYSSYYLI